MGCAWHLTLMLYALSELPLPSGRAALNAAALRRRRRGERAPVKLGALCRRSRRGREQKAPFYFLSDSQERLPSITSKLPLPSPLQSQARPG